MELKLKKISLLMVFAFALFGCANKVPEAISTAITDCSGNILENVSSRELTLCKAVPPAYPESALRAKIQGKCVNTFDVGTDGRIVNAVVSCIPAGYFEKAALANKKHFRYLPAVVNGKAVVSKSVSTTDTFSF
ncbi:MAG TPA: hypothetical protein DIW64_14890 [Cellvibrio sp.]|nr:hypothetical protein [Cellvibrio sp.]